MFAREFYLDDIRLGFSVLQDYLRPGGSMNLLDGNVHAEDFVASVLNALNGWSVKNTNRAVSNSPCLDLIDEGNAVGLQVTSEGGAAKINRTLDCLQKHGLATKIKKFIHFSLVPKQVSYAIREVPAGIEFDWRRDIVDFDMLLKSIQAADEKELIAVHRVVTKEMPRVFGTEARKLNALRTELHACQTLFDRELMRAPFDREDPVEMYKAIREIRISLQKRGASRIANQIVAANFEKARDILSVCEADVRKNYPYIHEAAKSGATPAYTGGAWGASIRRMMEIRGQLELLIKSNDAVLQELDRRISGA